MVCLWEVFNMTFICMPRRFITTHAALSPRLTLISPWRTATRTIRNDVANCVHRAALSQRNFAAFSLYFITDNMNLNSKSSTLLALLGACLWRLSLQQNYSISIMPHKDRFQKSCAMSSFLEKACPLSSFRGFGENSRFLKSGWFWSRKIGRLQPSRILISIPYKRL